MTVSLNHRLLATAAVGLIAAAGSAQASQTFTATLTHTQEVSTPPIPYEGSSGTATFVLNDAGTRLTYDVQLSGLDLDGLQTPANPNDDVTRAHFHAGAPGSNGGIVYGIIDGTASLRNDNNPNDFSISPSTGRFSGAWDAAEGNGTTLTAQLNALRTGGLYFNIHTFDHGGGEIRGQVLPEPSATMLLLGGVALPLLRARRRASVANGRP